MYLCIALVSLFRADWSSSFPTSPCSCPWEIKKMNFLWAVCWSLDGSECLYLAALDMWRLAKGEEKSESLGTKLFSKDILMCCGDRCWPGAHWDNPPSETMKFLLQLLKANSDQCVTASWSWRVCTPSPPLAWVPLGAAIAPDCCPLSAVVYISSALYQHRTEGSYQTFRSLSLGTLTANEMEWSELIQPLRHRKHGAQPHLGSLRHMGSHPLHKGLAF